MPPAPAFVIGCARSGTTFLGRILRENAGFCVTIEDPFLFPLVDELALYPHRRDSRLPDLVGAYRERIAAAAPRPYADKSHPNIWLAEPLRAAFEDALFLGIERSPYGTVASMLRHGAVLGHFRRWRSYPLPVRHLGLDEDTADRYEELPMTVKCALRWKSHHRRMRELEELMGDRLLVLRYESLVAHPGREARRLSDFLERPVTVPETDRETLSKWKLVLSRRQQAMIDRVLEGEAAGSS